MLVAHNLIKPTKMNKRKLLGIILPFLFLSCTKLSDNKNFLLGNTSDKMSARISVVTNNMQNKDGAFTGTASVQAIFKDDLNINDFRISDYSVNKKPSGMFFTSTSLDKELNKRISSFYGNPIKIRLNGVELSSLPKNPYANVVTIDNNLSTWQISKKKGLTLNWTVQRQSSNSNSVNTASTTSSNNLGPIEIVRQVENAVTVIALVPGDLLHTTGTSMYWVVPPNINSFTIDPSVLSAFGIGETIDISIGSGTNFLQYLNGSPIDILSINTTFLPGFSVIN